MTGLIFYCIAVELRRFDRTLDRSGRGRRIFGRTFLDLQWCSKRQNVDICRGW